MSGSRRRKKSEGLYDSFEYIQMNDFSKKVSISDESNSDSQIPQEILNLDLLPIAEAAKKAVTMVGPRVLKLTGIKGDKLRFIAKGCSGSGNKYQRAVSTLQQQLIAKMGVNFILHAGDIYYPDPPPSPDHPNVKTGFLDFDYPNGKGPPTFACPGNHEAKRCKNANYKNANFLLNPEKLEEERIDAVRNVAAITYVPDGVHFKKVSEIVWFMLQEKHDINKFQAFNMPFPYYAIEAGDIHIDFLNANTFLQSFLNYQRTQIDPEQPIKSYNEETFQVPWLIETTEEAADKFRIHGNHVPKYPQGKRAKKYDLDLFLPTKTYKEDLAELNATFGINTECHSTHISHALDYLGIDAKAYVCAHEHLLDVLNNNPIHFKDAKDATVEQKPPTAYSTRGMQICTGGGGGDRQRQQSFIGQEELGFLLSNPGLVLCSIDLKNPQDMEIDVYALDHEINENQAIRPRHHLKFNLQQREPIRNVSKDERVEKLREILLQASNKFLIKHHVLISKTPHPKANASQNFLSSLTNTLYDMGKKAQDYWYSTYTPNDIDHIHDLICDLNQADGVLTFREVQNHFNVAIAKLGHSQLFQDEITLQIAEEKKQNPTFDVPLYTYFLRPIEASEGLTLTR